jgi:hypothetical protein
MKNAFKIKFSIVVLSAAVLFATATCAAAATATTTTPADALPLTIPKDAVLNPDGRTYSYTDKQGKKWSYVRTVFGLRRFPASDQPAAPVPPDYSRIKVVDKGDTVRFEKPGPLGPLGWEKKKSEFTDEERGMYDAWQARAAKAATQQNEKTQ